MSIILTNNNDEVFSQYFAILPDEIKDIIWEYVHPKKKVFVSKYYYQKYHKFYATYFKINKVNYFRNIIKNDAWFILKQLLIDNLYDINNNKIMKIKYKNYYYKNYISFIADLIFIYNSKKCGESFFNFFGTNKFKRKYIYHKWTN